MNDFEIMEARRRRAIEYITKKEKARHDKNTTRLETGLSILIIIITIFILTRF